LLGPLPPNTAERRAALGLPPPITAPSLADRVGAVADALGTSASRLLVGAAIAVLLAGAIAWSLLAAPAPPPNDDAIPRAAAGSSSSGSSSRQSAPGPPAANPSEVVVVYAAGAVMRPGLYRLASSARAADVLDAAGGPAPDADLDQLNLAALVGDGERVYVPRRGERPPDALATGPPGSRTAGPPTFPLNLNSATAEQLDALPGVGPATARAILAWREQHGRFKRVDDLLNVRGIGMAKLDALRAQVKV
jgi:competence protein ComEA